MSWIIRSSTGNYQTKDKKEKIFYVENLWKKNLIKKYIKFQFLTYTQEEIHSSIYLAGFIEEDLPAKYYVHHVYHLTFCNFEFIYRITKEE